MASPSNIKPVSQAEFDIIVDENVTEFDMSEEEAVRDALDQLKGRDVTGVAKTSEEKRTLQTIKEYCDKVESLRTNMAKVLDFLKSTSSPPAFIVKPIIEHGVLGMAMQIMAKDLSVPASQIVEVLCDTSAMARDVVPPVGLGVLCDLLTKHAVLIRPNLAAAKDLEEPSHQQVAFLEATLRALVAIMKQHEMNKRVLHEKQFSTSISALMTTCSIAPAVLKALLLATTRAIRAYLQDDDSRPNAIEFDGFARGRKLGEETDVVEELTKHLAVDDSISTTLRLICVNDNICRKALECGALNNAVGWIEEDSPTGTKKVAGLNLVRHLCLNDEAKLKIGLDPRAARALLHSVEMGLEDNDDASLSAALSCLGVVLLRQPRCCDALAEMDAIPLLIRVLSESTSPASLKSALIALRNFVSHPSNDYLKRVALDAGAEKACRAVAERGDASLKTFAQDCLRDLGISNYRMT